MIGHARWLLWEGYSSGYIFHPDRYNLLDKVIMWGLNLFKYGHEAVLLFFVLSGFVIHLRYARNIRREGLAASFDYKDYVIRRIRRLYPPFLLALLVTTIADKTGILLNLPVYFGHTPYDRVNMNIHAFSGIENLFWNLIFFMGLKLQTPVYGSNGPLWSLAYEWWFYMIYPLFFLLSRRSARLTLLVVMGLFLLQPYLFNLLFYETPGAQFLFGPLVVLRAFGSWWLGVVLADIYAHRIRISFGWIAGMLPLSVLFYYIPNSYFFGDFIFAMAFMGLLAFLFWLQEKKIELTLFHKLAPLGEFSYSLYVIHLPVLVFMSGLLMKQSPDGKLPANQIWIFVGIGISIFLAKGAWYIAERPFVKK
jgi:peptidoglycan/LPS O-acetylase OafA/YrhL